VAVDATTLKSKEVQEGVRYYMPKPYLLVTEVPADPTTKPNDNKNNGTESTSTSRTTTDTSSTNNSAKGSSGDNGSGTSPSASTDTSFSMFTKQYGVKLIYLPDYSQPMVITENPGIFGSAEMKPVLQDGWMLTSLDASGDSKVSETIASLASLVGSAMGGGGSNAAGSSKGKTASGTESTAAAPAALPILPPGLYELTTADGRPTVRPVMYFCNSGPQQEKCS